MSDDVQPIDDDIADCISRYEALEALEYVAGSIAEDLPREAVSGYVIAVTMNRCYQAINQLNRKLSSRDD